MLLVGGSFSAPKVVGPVNPGGLAVAPPPDKVAPAVLPLLWVLMLVGGKLLVPALLVPKPNDWLPNAVVLLLELSPKALAVLPNGCMLPPLLLAVAKAFEEAAAALAPKAVAPNMLDEGTPTAGAPKARELLDGTPAAGAPKAGNPKEGKEEGTAVLAAVDAAEVV